METQVSFWYHFAKSGYQFRISGPEEVTISSDKKMVTTFIGAKNPASFIASCVEF